MPEVTIGGEAIEVPGGETVLRACKLVRGLAGGGGMRLLARVLAGALFGLSFAAAAQTANETPIDNLPARDDASVEKMLSDAEKDRMAARGNDDVSRTALAQWAGCLASKNSAEAARVLSMDFTTPTYDRAFRMLTDEDKQCRKFRGRLRTQRLLLAGELAETLIEQDYAPIVNTLAKAASGPATPAFSFTDRVAICVVRSVPSDVAKLFATERNSAEEAAAVQMLATPTGLCAQAAQAKRPLAVNPAGLRAMLATAAFRSAKDI